MIDVTAWSVAQQDIEPTVLDGVPPFALRRTKWLTLLRATMQWMMDESSAQVVVRFESLCLVIVEMELATSSLQHYVYRLIFFHHTKFVCVITRMNQSQIVSRVLLHDQWAKSTCT